MASNEVPPVPLNSNYATPLILELYGGGQQPVRRRDIQQPVIDLWIERGGMKPQDNPDSIIKTALQNLRNSNQAFNHPGTPWWTIKVDPTSTEELNVEDGPEQVGDDVLGSDETVYAYYYPTYKENASLKNEKYWPVKVGFTGREVAQRVQDQVGTAIPEEPETVVLVETQSGRAWERLLHGCLSLANRKMPDARGDEWYLTSPSELKRLIESLNSLLSALEKSDDKQ